MEESLPMADTPRCTILVGSLRRDSINKAAADCAGEYLAGRFTLYQPDLSGIPPFNQDVEDAGDPPAVADLKAAVSGSELVLIFSPEYNYGIPGLLKNTIDWLSRPFRAGTLMGKVVGITSVTPGSRGGENSREQLLQTCGVLTERLYRVTLGIPNVSELENGTIPESSRSALHHWLEELVLFSQKVTDADDF
ncbi:MAG: NADPH-dependent FMN reductase [Acidimicrobiales bacterium MED-G01]|nr:MAG: NADPH-dependent FMN reductase [Acidimicrobiales bacterium MED-G01]